MSAVKVIKTVADEIIETLVSSGVTRIFLLPGGGCMYLVDAIARSRSLDYTVLLHEQSVGIAAEAYAQYTNRIAVALVTTGPGVTNSLTACAAAWTDSTPMLFISGQVKTTDSRDFTGVRQFGFQELPTIDMVKPITKLALKLTEDSDVGEQVSKLIEIASTGRPGPVWLDVPLDIQNAPIEISNPLRVNVKQRNPKSGNQKNTLSFLKESLSSSQRPLFLLGNGVRLGGSINDFKEITKFTGIPALLTWKMIDFMDEEDELNGGRPGSIAQPWSNIIQEESDLLISIGARIDMGQCAYNLSGFAKKAKKIVFDVDPLEIKKFENKSDFFTFQMNSSEVSKLFFDLSNENFFDFDRWSEWRKLTREVKARYAPHFYRRNKSKDGVDLYNFINILSDVLPKKSIIVPGSSGACSEVVMQAFRVKYGQRIFNSEGLGSMGFAIPAAIGTHLASGGAKIISIDGDGGFLMNVQELASVSLHTKGLIFFILNNNGYGSIKTTQDKYFNGRRVGTDPNSGLALTNISKLANAFDLKFDTLRNDEDVVENLERIVMANENTLVEIIVKNDQRTTHRVSTLRDANHRFLPADMAVLDT